MYECHALAFVAEQAGGMASDGVRRIMEIEPSEIHQKTPIFLGSKKMVEKVNSHFANRVETEQY